MAEKPVYGGHDCEFVQEVSDRLNCNICTKVLRDPHLAVCCGQHFCESCLNKWFTRQGKESCPHCRAEGEAFHHVIDKSVGRAVNELKIRCSNHGEGCRWTGELRALKKHLESDNGCGFVMVECPNKCLDFDGIVEIKRKDVHDHLTQDCNRRAYQCRFCGLKDTYEIITGGHMSLVDRDLDGYSGHQAKCPEAPLICPNECGADKIKRKDMKSHCSQCPQEPVECPFAEAGCKIDVRRHQFDNHMTTSLQQHLMLLLIDRKQLKSELYEVKDELDETKRKLFGVEAHLTTGPSIDFSCAANQLENKGDSLKLKMRKYSEYRYSGKVWHSSPFYYREGYKMCLAVYANGVGEGAGTHVSIEILHVRGEYDDKLKWPMKSCVSHPLQYGRCQFLACRPLQCQEVNGCKQIECKDRFFNLNSKAFPLVNNCLTFTVKFNQCYLGVSITE